MRNTPLHTRRPRDGYTPEPGTVVIDHPSDQITPNKQAISMTGMSSDVPPPDDTPEQ